MSETDQIQEPGSTPDISREIRDAILRILRATTNGEMALTNAQAAVTLIAALEALEE